MHIGYVCIYILLVQENGASFEGSMLKLLRTLPKVLKYLPSDKAAVSYCKCFDGGIHCYYHHYLFFV